MRTRPFVLSLVVVLSSCAAERKPSGPAVPAATPTLLTSVLLDGVPHVAQKPDFCGEACVAMWLGKLGHGGDQDWVYDMSHLDPTLGRGVFSAELASALSAIGFDAGPGWYSVAAGDPDGIDRLFADLHADLLRGVPSVVCMRTGLTRGASEHMRLVLGYDAATDEVIYHEPAEEAGAYRRMPRTRFLRHWPLPYEARRSTVIRFRLEPKRALVAAERPAGVTAADAAQHMMNLKDRIPAGFTAVWSPPFVVLGDGPPDEVADRAHGTVAWAVSQLKARYFARDPDEVLEIWLFKDAASYQKHGKQLFGEGPDTPYGYYSPQHGALVMNIATGGGTLVHEIVHPYVHANFPDAPAWFNEGLGSLYEQSDERNGKIVGLTNWRLRGLQNAINDNSLPSFRALTSTTDSEFYNGATAGTNYAQARYLLYYLQEQPGELLERFYREFHAARAKDPTGYATLRALLGEDGRDMKAFQRAWEAWVLTLVFEQ